MSRLTRGHIIALPVRGYHPLRPGFPDRFHLSHIRHWPDPRSLATTRGVSVDVLSSGYLDVSVPRVRFKPLCIQDLIPSSENWKSEASAPFPRQNLGVPVFEGGFPHSEISGSKLICSSPKLIAACHVFHRLLMPRHSPCTLYSLTFCLVTFWFSNKKFLELCRLLRGINCSLYYPSFTEKFPQIKMFYLSVACLILLIS